MGRTPPGAAPAAGGGGPAPSRTRAAAERRLDRRQLGLDPVQLGFGGEPLLRMRLRLRLHLRLQCPQTLHDLLYRDLLRRRHSVRPRVLIRPWRCPRPRTPSILVVYRYSTSVGSVGTLNPGSPDGCFVTVCGGLLPSGGAGRWAGGGVARSWILRSRILFPKVFIYPCFLLFARISILRISVNPISSPFLRV